MARQSEAVRIKHGGAIKKKVLPVNVCGSAELNRDTIELC